MYHLALAPDVTAPVATLTAHDAVRITAKVLNAGPQWRDAVALTTTGEAITVVADAPVTHYANNICVPNLDSRVMALESLIAAAQKELTRLDPRHSSRRRIDVRLSLLLAAVEYPD